MANDIQLSRPRLLASLPGLPSRVLLVVVALGGVLGLTAISDAEFLPWLLTAFPAQLLPVLAVLTLCLLPGLALLRWCWPTAALPLSERLVLALGLGIGLPALLFSGLFLLGVAWPSWGTLIYLGLALVALLVPRKATGQQAPSEAPWVGTALLTLTLAGLLGRLYTGRELIVGANADSVHHTLIAHLLAVHGGLFRSWEPFAPLDTFTYHYGFHALVTHVHWLTGWPIPELLPVVGQALAALIIPALAVLTTRMTGHALAGLFAGLLAGFVNTQPAFYVFWGRYPFIASHVLLVAVVLFWMHALTAPRLRIGPLVLAAVTSAALAHVHYQTTVLAALFLGSYLLVLLLRTPSLQTILALVGRAALIGGIALVLAAPWLLNTLSGELDRNVSYNSDRQTGAAFGGIALLPLSPFYLKSILIGLALLGVLVALRRKHWPPVLLAGWALLTLFAVIPYLVGLPGTGMIEPSVGPLALYLSVAPLAGYPLGLLVEWLARLRPAIERLAIPLVILACIPVVSWGIGWQRNLAPAYIRLYTPADQRAFSWILANTPSDARFVVNSNPLYGGLMLVGTDAGSWIPLLTGRTTTVPPLPYGSEHHSDTTFASRTHNLAEALRGASMGDLRPRLIDLTNPRALKALREARVRYVYIGAQALVGAQTFPQVDRFDPLPLRTSPDFQLRYDQAGVLIYELVDR